MSTSRVGETFDERPMTELMGLCTFLLAPMWSSWAFNKSSATECGGKKKAIMCREQKGKFMAAESRLIEVAELQK